MLLIVQRNLLRVKDYKKERWIVFIILQQILILRVLQCRGYYLVEYINTIFIINNFVKFFLTFYGHRVWLVDPNESVIQNSNDLNNDPDLEIFHATALSALHHEGQTLETAPNDQNIIYAVTEVDVSSELLLWYRCVIVVIVALIASLIPLINVPVYWPILVGYTLFIFLCNVYKFRAEIQTILTSDYTPLGHQ